MKSSKLVILTPLGLLKSWHNYQELVNGRDKLLDCEILWSDLVLEEIRRNTRDGVTSRSEEEEKFTFARKRKKAQVKRKSSYN